MKYIYPPLLAALLVHQLAPAEAAPLGGRRPRKTARTAAPALNTPDSPEKSVTGTVRIDGGESLPGATVFIKGSFIGTSTDAQGRFSLDLNFENGPVTLVVSYVGYDTRELEVPKPNNALNVALFQSATLLNETIVSASRVEENILRAPVTVEKLSTRQIEKISTPEVLNSLSHYKGIDVTSASLLFTSVSTRGFNTAKSERLIQLVDYADMQMPSLNFSPGNLVGIPELDLESVEIIHGPASALYGSNALSGVVLFNSKDPYIYEGLSARIRGGERSFLDGQIRYAKKLGEKWAVKVNGSYFTADEWLPNNYDADEVYSRNATGSPLGYDAVNRYGDDLPMTYSPDQDIPDLFTVSPELYGKTVYAPGFTEKELLAGDTKTRNYRAQGSVSYLIKDDLKATLEAKRAQGASTYQNLSRVRCGEIGVNQYRAELKNKRGFLRAYSTEDFTYKTYDIVALGGLLQNAPTGEGSSLSYGQTYFLTYNEAYKQARSGGLTPEQALVAAQQAANSTQLKSSNPRFATLRKGFIADNQLSQGAGLGFSSFLNDVSGQYSFTPREGMELTTGAAYREYRLDKAGQLFATKPDGERIHNYEYGAYAQLTQQLLDDHLKLALAVRADEFKNFDLAISPRASAVYTLGADKQHNFRASYGSAFRSPSQLEQYFRADLGSGILLGNVGSGYQGYGVNETNDGIDFNKPFTIDRLKLERVNTFEVGYKGLVAPELYFDVNYYFNYYQDFIGGSTVLSNVDGSPPTPAQLEDGAAVDFGPGQPTRIISTFYNNNRTLRTQGLAASLTYYAVRALNLTANYTLNVLDDKDLPKGFQTFFNTPKHKYNLGAEGMIGPAFRYSVNYRWVQGHLQETFYATGRIRTYSTVDGYLGYALPKAFTTLQAGVSNLFNGNNVQVYGAPSIGRIAYLGVLLDIK